MNGDSVTPDRAIDYLERAEDTLVRLNTSELVTDEAELLRGCLAALVSMARQMYAEADSDWCRVSPDGVHCPCYAAGPCCECRRSKP